MSLLTSNVVVINHQSFLFGGFTPLHAAVRSHNAVVKEMRTFKNPCSFVAAELAQRGQMYIECIKTLLFMGASYGTKVFTLQLMYHLQPQVSFVFLFHIVTENFPFCSCRKPLSQVKKRLKVHIRHTVVSSANMKKLQTPCSHASLIYCSLRI